MGKFGFGFVWEINEVWGRMSGKKKLYSSRFGFSVRSIVARDIINKHRRMGTIFQQGVKVKNQVLSYNMIR